MCLAAVSAACQESAYPRGYNGGALAGEPTLSGGGRLLEVFDVSACSVHGCDDTTSARGLCGAHYQRWRRHRDPEFVPMATRPTEERFWAAVDKTTACWVWKSRKMSSGYGVFSIGGKKYGAHRVSWNLAHGPIPFGLFVCHHCDNKLCVRPEHLFLGTQMDNMQDMHRKGRYPDGERHWTRVKPERIARGEKNGSRLHPGLAQGSRNGQSKLTDDDVRTIRNLRTGGLTLKTIGDRFGISQGAVCLVVARKTWAHVE